MKLSELKDDVEDQFIFSNFVMAVTDMTARDYAKFVFESTTAQRVIFVDMFQNIVELFNRKDMLQ